MTEEEAEKFTQFRYAIPESVNDIVRRTVSVIEHRYRCAEDKFPAMMSFTQIL